MTPSVEEIGGKAIAAVRQDCRATQTFAVVVTATASEDGTMADFCMRTLGFAKENPNGPSALLAEALDQLAQQGANVIVMDMPHHN